MEDRERFIALISAAAAEAPFHAVIDFTGFHRDYIRDTIKALHTVSESEVIRNVDHYIFISTDSVYMGAKRPFPSLRVGSGMRAGAASEADGLVERLVETDAVMPENKEQRSALRRWNKYQYGYGGNKLGCEEELASWHVKTGFPYTALRLPDVMGPCVANDFAKKAIEIHLSCCRATGHMHSLA